MGKINLLFPMVAHRHEILQIREMVARARQQLDLRGEVHGPVRLGAMIEVPAAAMTVPMFLKAFRLPSIGTNDLIQYTLAIDRVDESVSHLYDPAPGGAAARGRHHRRMPQAGQVGQRLRRDGG